MYRCKECYAEYKIQVDYCDCGNDTFDFFEETVQTNRLTLSPEKKLQILSWVFFTICVILAILVWFIPVNNKKEENPQSSPKQVVSKPIPDIEKIWNDTPKQQPKTTQTAPTNYTKQPSNKVAKQTKTQPKTVPQNTNKIVEKKTTKAPIPKNTLNATKNQSSTQTTHKTTNKTVTKPTNKITTNQQKTIQEPKKPIYNPNSPAMIEYKTKLRAALFNKFAVGSIQGSGSCSISFSVDKTGKLVNRKFTRESDNKTLNDTVYYMLMSLPYFSVPPAEYNGETIKMEFSIYNGNYEISIN